MNTKIKKITVMYRDRIVGYLHQIDDSTISFQYHQQWVIDGFSISPFSLPLTNDIFTSHSRDLKGLYGVFWDHLPQGWGCKVLQRKLMKLGIDYSKLNFLTKLSLTTNSPRGALRFLPNQLSIKTNNQNDLDKLNLFATNIIKNKSNKSQEDVITSFSSTSGGAKPKIHIDINNQQWIIKLNIDNDNLGKSEYDSNVLAKKAGIKVNEFKLFTSKSGQKYFGSKRFDRDLKNNPIHMISLCGLLETAPQIPNLDYCVLMQVIDRISINKIDDMYEAYRRMVFNVLYGNKDDHGGNWSFLYDEKLHGYVLSPFYDITYTGNVYAEHEMTVLGNGQPTIDDMIHLAQKFNLSIKRCTKIINKVKEALKNS